MRHAVLYRILLLSIAFVLLAGVPAFGVTPLVANDDTPGLIKVRPTDPVTGSQFGRNLALSGETLVVSRDYDSRAVYVFERDATGWGQRQKITLPDEKDATALAIDGDTLAICLEGEVQVWTRIDGTWSKQATLTNTGDDYISAAAIDGDTLVAGHYVFLRTGTSWAMQQKLSSGRNHRHDNFGQDVRLVGNTLVISAATENTPTRGAGAVYVFERTGTTWTRKARLVRDNPAQFDTLGGSLAFDGNQIVAGVSGWESQTGAICFWRRSGSTWVYQQQISSPDGSPGNLVDYGGDSFGISMGLAGDTLVVGAPEDDDKGSNSGSLYVLKRINGTWVNYRKITDTTGSAENYLGIPVAVDNGRVVAGMRRINNEAGGVYAFDLGFSTVTDKALNVTSPAVLVNDAVPEGITVSKASSPAQGHASVQSSGAFTYAPKAGWKGTDSFTYKVALGAATSNAAKVNVQTWQPTRLTLSAGKPVSYKTAAKLKATLKTLSGKPLAGKYVRFEHLSGTKWVSMGSIKTDSKGVATKSTSKLSSGKTYRVRTSYSADHGSAFARLRVKPKASLTRPATPSTVGKGSSFKTTGYLKPRHKSGSKAIKLYFYRYQSGKWVKKKVVTATVKDYSGYSRYSKSTTLPSKGKWKVRAYHPADSGHSATWSSTEYLRVK